MNVWGAASPSPPSPWQAITAAFRMAAGAETARKPPPFGDGSTGRAAAGWSLTAPGSGRYPCPADNLPLRKAEPGSGHVLYLHALFLPGGRGFSGYRGLHVREAARELFRLLEKEGAFHPATLMYPAHRQSRRKGIRRMLKAAAPFPGSVD